MSSTYLIPSVIANTFSRNLDPTNDFLTKLTPVRRKQMRQQFANHMKSAEFDAFIDQFTEHYKCTRQKRLSIAFFKRNNFVNGDERLARNIFNLFVRNKLLYANGLIRTDLGHNLTSKEIQVKLKRVNFVPEFMLLKSIHHPVNLSNLHKRITIKHRYQLHLIKREFGRFFVGKIRDLILKYNFKNRGNLYDFTIACGYLPLDMYFIIERLESYLSNLPADHDVYSLKYFFRTLRIDHEITTDQSLSQVTREIVQYAHKNMIPLSKVDEFDEAVKALKKPQKLLKKIVKDAIANAKGKIFSVMYFLTAITNYFLSQAKLAKRRFMCTLFRNYSSNIEIINKKIVPLKCKNSLKFNRIIDHEELYNQFGDTVYRLVIQKHLHKYDFMPHRSEFKKWLLEEQFIVDETIKQLKTQSEERIKADIKETALREERMKADIEFNKLDDSVKPLIKDIMAAIVFPIEHVAPDNKFTIKDGILAVRTQSISHLERKIFEEKEKKNNDYSLVIRPELLPVFKKHNITQVIIEYNLDDKYLHCVVHKGITNEITEKENTAIVTLKQLP